MDASTTLTVRLTTDVKEQLKKLADSTKRTKSFLAAQAIEAYVAREIKIIEGIQRGLEDMRQGRLVPHDKVMDDIDAMIDGIERSKH